MNRKGREWIDKGDYAKAYQSLSEAVKTDPSLAAAWNARGYLLLRQRKYADALSDFNQALQVDPTYVNALHNRAIVRKLLGDRAGATADERRIQELYPKH